MDFSSNPMSPTIPVVLVPLLGPPGGLLLLLLLLHLGGVLPYATGVVDATVGLKNIKMQCTISHIRIIIFLLTFPPFNFALT